MSIWIVIVVLVAALSVMLVLDAAARWKHGASLVLDHYEHLLSDSRDRAAAREEDQQAATTKAQPFSEPPPDPSESDSGDAEPSDD